MKAVVVGVLLCGCAEIPSDGLKTQGMDVWMSATSTGTGDTTVAMQLSLVGHPHDTIVLAGGDALVADDGVEQKSMADSADITNEHTYKAIFATEDGNTRFTVQLVRPDIAPPTASVVLPDPFDLAPLPTSISRSRDLVVRWPRAKGTIEITVTGTCIDEYEDKLDVDPGHYTVHGLQWSGSARRCPITVTVYRDFTGRVDGVFDSGETRGTQQRSARLDLRP